MRIRLSITKRSRCKSQAFRSLGDTDGYATSSEFDPHGSGSFVGEAISLHSEITHVLEADKKRKRARAEQLGVLNEVLVLNI
jgi:hypothetical protein